jgi:hypothetical protein
MVVSLATLPKFLSFSLSLSLSSKKLTYRTHITNTLRKANYRLRQLFPILNKSSTIDINLALIIYRSLLQSILTYTYINKLQTFQNKLLRLITKLPRVTPIATLNEQTGMTLLRRYIKMLTGALYRMSAGSENIQIQELGQYDPTAAPLISPC